MAPRKKPAPKADPPRTPVAEWIAASTGLVLTLAVLGYSLWEAAEDRGGPPDLIASAEQAQPVSGGFVVPVVVRNRSYATAAAVELRASLTMKGRTVEARRATFTYVPGGGEARGGVMFRRNPGGGRLVLEVEGYEEP